MSTIPSPLSRPVARKLALSIAALRVALGVVVLVEPHPALAFWVGRDDAKRIGTRLLGRALGGRDLALGLGPLLATRHDASIRGWVEAGMLADAGDTVATLLAFGRLPRVMRWLVLAMTLGALGGAAISIGAVES